MVEISECNFNNPAHERAVIDLMNIYMADFMGGELPEHTVEKAQIMVKGLREHSSKLILLAHENGQFVGLANCFINFGTFAAKPFINIHDVVVDSRFRGQGTGRKLMEAIVEKAKELGCGKITLEVREDNILAQKLYKSIGFADSEPVMHFWSKFI